MNISQINNINFGAKYIRSSQVEKYNLQKGVYEPAEISFIELNPENYKDYIAINDFSLSLRGKSDAFSIADTAELLREQVLSKDVYKIYALTTQENHFAALKPDKILAIGELQKLGNKNHELDYLLIKPSLTGTNEKKEFKKIGTTFLNMLKSLDKVESIAVTSFSKSQFYKNNGFRFIDGDIPKYFWRQRGKLK